MSLRGNITGNIKCVNADFIALMENYDQFVLSTTESMIAQGTAVEAAIHELQKLETQFKSAKTAVQQFGIEIAEQGFIPILLEANIVLANFANAMSNNIGVFKTVVGVTGLLIPALIYTRSM